MPCTKSTGPTLALDASKARTHTSSRASTSARLWRRGRAKGETEAERRSSYAVAPEMTLQWHEDGAD